MEAACSWGCQTGNREKRGKSLVWIAEEVRNGRVSEKPAVWTARQGNDEDQA